MKIIEKYSHVFLGWFLYEFLIIIYKFKKFKRNNIKTFKYFLDAFKYSNNLFYKNNCSWNNNNNNNNNNNIFQLISDMKLIFKILYYSNLT